MQKLTGARVGAGAGGAGADESTAASRGTSRELRGVSFAEGEEALSTSSGAAPTMLRGERLADAIAYNSGRPYTKQAWAAIQRAVGVRSTGVPDAETARAVARWQVGRDGAVDGKVSASTSATLLRDADDKSPMRAAGDVIGVDPGALREAREDAAIRAALARWELAPPALDGAVALMKKVPAVAIVSGRRTRTVEANAWAYWIAEDKDWMWKTLIGYRTTTPLHEVQAWLDANWSTLAGDAATISARLLATFNAMSDDELGGVTQHTSGHAIDISFCEGVDGALLSTLPNYASSLKERDHWHIGFARADASAKAAGSGL